MTTIDDLTFFVTEVQHACKKARESRNATDLEAARKLMDSDGYRALPKGNQEDLAWAYASAVNAVTGGGMG